MGTWRGDPDDAAARYLAEHGMVGRVDGGEMVIEVGNGALLPPWPPADTESVARAKAEPTAPNILCAVCGTEVKLHGDAGWRHELGYKATGGCEYPWPEG